MCKTCFNIHDVSRIAVSAHTAPSDRGVTFWWQTIRFFDGQGAEIGEVIAFLDRPDVALPVGDQPPYWGMDLSKPLVLENGEAPF